MSVPFKLDLFECGQVLVDLSTASKHQQAPGQQRGDPALPDPISFQMLLHPSRGKERKRRRV